MKVTVAQKLEFDELKKMVTDLLMSSSKAEQWMRTKNRNLGGFTPLELIKRDKGHKVREFIYDADQRRNDKLIKEGKRSGAV